MTGCASGRHEQRLTVPASGSRSEPGVDEVKVCEISPVTSRWQKIPRQRTYDKNPRRSAAWPALHDSTLIDIVTTTYPHPAGRTPNGQEMRHRGSWSGMRNFTPPRKGHSLGRRFHHLPCRFAISYRQEPATVKRCPTVLTRHRVHNDSGNLWNRPQHGWVNMCRLFI